MIKIKTISFQEWFLIAPGIFLIGLSLGLVIGGFSFAPWIFLVGFLIEIPSLIALQRHK